MRVPFLLIFSILFTSNIFAQPHKCSSDAHQENLMNDPAYAIEFQKLLQTYQRKAATTTASSRSVCPSVITLPVAVHFQNITSNDRSCLESLVAQQIARVNADFQAINEDFSNWTSSAAAEFPNTNSGSMCVEFCVATQNHPSGYGLSNGQQAVTINRMTNTDRNTDWAGYINIYVLGLENNLLGYSPLGGRGNGDGVVIGKHAFGGVGSCGDVSTASTLDRGRTLTHELGHYFFLYHVWGNVENCNFDDGLQDTPSCDGPNFFCPQLGKSSCGTKDLHMNYMDYSNDECMYMFTAQQVQRMEDWVTSNLSHVVNNASSVCGSTTVATCTDGIQNGNETGIDCGGTCTVCPTCDDGVQNGDETGVDCGGTCSACVTCDDGIQNGDETGIDCGGSCGACTPTSSCADGIRNGNETGVDCGGDCPECPPTPTCNDNIQNGNETGIDCGGSCTPCPSCDDGFQNGDETGIDCGGSCDPCQDTGNNNCEQNSITITLVTDLYGSETTWDVKDENGTTLSAGGPYTDFNQATIDIDLCLESGCYTFNLYDAFGDGICCDWGQGSYTIRDDQGTILDEGSDFGFIATSVFSAGGPDCGNVVIPEVCSAPNNSNVGYYTDFTRVQIAWAPVPDANRYQVQYRRTGDSNWRSTRTGRTTKTIRRLTTGTQYEYRIRSRCPEGWTSYGEAKTFTTLSGRIPGGVKLLEYEEITVNHVFPNPTSDVLKLDYSLEVEGEVVIAVYDMLGRQVLVQKYFQEDGTQKVALDVSNLQGGTHILQIRTEEEMVVKKFIKR